MLYEQETTVGPKVTEEVAKFDGPVLTRIVLKPIVHFSYFPRLTLLRFHDFSDKDERIEKAVRACELAEWSRSHTCSASLAARCRSLAASLGSSR